MNSCCCSTRDRSLTNFLIETSNSILHCFHNFSNKSHWIDGLDTWSLEQQNQGSTAHQNSFDFHSDIGLYLPKSNKDHLHDKFNEGNSICSKNKATSSISERNERRTQLDHKGLVANDPGSHPSDEAKSINDDHDHDYLRDMENQSSKSSQHLKLHEVNNSKVRKSLRHVPSQNNYWQVHQTNQRQQKCYETINKESLKLLLKEQLTSLFCRDTVNINARRSFIKIPTINIKHQNHLAKPIPLSDSTILTVRSDRLRPLAVNQLTGQTIAKSHVLDIRRSPIHFPGMSDLGLSITPIDFPTSRNLENYSIETKSDQLNQQISTRCSVKRKEENDGTFRKTTSDNAFQRSSTNLCISTKGSIDEQKQLIQKFSRHYYSLSKSPLPRSKTFQIMPSLVTGKRIHTPVTNPRFS